jgi:4-amino-4-deoxychorismate lyase
VTKGVWVNGVKQDTVSARDRGLQFGDGLFETMAVIDGEIRRLERHLDRLQAGCERLGIPSPSRERLIEDLRSHSESESRAVLKLVVTRGVGGRGYRIEDGIEPTRIVSLHTWPSFPADWAESGVVVRWCEATLAEQPMLAGIKHLNRLEQVVARREWSDPGIAEGLMCDSRGRVIGGTRTNLFLVRGSELVTPSVHRCGLAGTMRASVIEVAGQLGLRAIEIDIWNDDVEQAEEIFLTNALIGIWPVKQIDRRSLVVGPATRRLQTATHAPRR